jgi:enterochelin esterase family protein
MTAGRLAPIAALIEAAVAGEVDIGPQLESCFAGTVPGPLMGYWGHVLSWNGTALIAVASEQPTAIALDGADPVPMTSVPGTSYWFKLDLVEEGRVRSYKLVVDGEWTDGREFPGYLPLSHELPDVRPGTISEKRTVKSRIYPGATTEYWVYANHGIDEEQGAPVLVCHDGGNQAERDEFNLRQQIVSDNLVHVGQIPPLVQVLVRPSQGSEERATGFDSGSGPIGLPMRTLQYATISDRYGRHLLDELLPEVEKTVKLRSDAYSRGSLGRSDGGLCAFKLAWLQPDEFSRAHCTNATFTAKTWDPEQGQDAGFMFPQQVRRGPKRNIRVWLSTGTNDMELSRGSWPLGNIDLANALKLNGYDFRFRFREGHHSSGESALDLPESLAWLWRGYDPERTQQVFDQDSEERDKPPFRVRIVNRDT